MNSVAIVESPAGQGRLYYMVTVLSNVLRKNSAQDHQDLARAIHGMLEQDHPQTPEQREAAAHFGEGFVGFEAERAELRLAADTQEALLALGFDIGEVDGQIGTSTRDAIRDFERSQGRKPSGKPSPELLEVMRRVAVERGLARPAPTASTPTP
jgi:hypothetical protein